MQNVFFLLILGTLMVPVQVTSVALYIQLSKIGWVDTFLGILAPNFASAFGVFMLRQGIKQIPVDVIEAARIDGAGEMRIVLTIITPLIKTTVATVAMICSWAPGTISSGRSSSSTRQICGPSRWPSPSSRTRTATSTMGR